MKSDLQKYIEGRKRRDRSLPPGSTPVIQSSNSASYSAKRARKPV